MLQDNERDLLGGLLHTGGGGAGPDRLPAAGVHCAQGGGSREVECGEEDSQAKEKIYGIDCPLSNPATLGGLICCVRNSSPA